MSRSLFPDGVEVTQADLVRESDARDTALLDRFTDLTQFGIASGLTVTVATTTTCVKIAVGSAYAASGERVEVLMELDNNSLADYSNAALNYVTLVYTEVYGSPQAHESSGLTMNTAATDSYRVRVFTAAQYAALNLSDPNFSNDAADRTVLLAIVTAKGAGVPLTAGDIQLPTTSSSVISVSQPIISGVVIMSAAPVVPVGTGQIRYTAGVPGTLEWAAPGGTFGTPVSIPTDGTYTLTSSAAAYSIQVSVIVASLPSTLVPVVSTVQVTSLYSTTIPQFSARDEVHRHMLGSVAPTRSNPHGTSIVDIIGASGGVNTILQEHQDKLHANGIIKNSAWGPSRSTLKLSIQHTGGSSDAIAVGAFGAGDEAIVNGLSITSITSASSPLSFAGMVTGWLELWGIYCTYDVIGVGRVTRGYDDTAPLARVRMNATGTGVGGISPDPFGGLIQVVDVSDGFVTSAYQDFNIRYTLSDDMLWLEDPTTTQYPIRLTARPATDTIVRLWHYDDVRWVDVWVRGTGSFVADASVNIRIYAPATSNSSMLLGYVVSHGTATTVLGYGLYGIPGITTNNVVDRRSFGTQSYDNLSDDAISKLTTDDRHSNTYTRGFGLGTIAGGSLPVQGGIIYVGGKRYEAANQSVAVSDGVSYVYAAIDSADAVVVSVNTNYATAASLGTVLWSITVTAGVLTSSNRLIRLGTQIEDKLAVTVDPDGINGAFTTLADAVAYITIVGTGTPSEIVCHRGTYAVSAPLVLPANTWLHGDSANSVILSNSGSATVIVTGGGCKISDLSIVNASNTNTVTGIRTIGSDTIEHVTFDGGAPGAPVNVVGFDITNAASTIVVVSDCILTKFTLGVRIAAGAVNDVTVRDCVFTFGLAVAGTSAIYSSATNILTVSDCSFNWNTAVVGTYARAGIQLSGSGQATLINNNTASDNSVLTATRDTTLVYSAATSTAIHDVIISNNVVTDTRTLCSLSTTTTSTLRGITIDSNQYTRAAQAAYASGTCAVYLASSDTTLNYPTVGLCDVSVTNNKFTNPGATVISTIGLVGTLNVINNTIRSDDGKGGIGISVTTTTAGTNNVAVANITGNTIYNLQGTSGSGVHNIGVYVYTAGLVLHACNILDNTLTAIGNANGTTGADGYGIQIFCNSGSAVGDKIKINQNIIESVKTHSILSNVGTYTNAQVCSNTVRGYSGYGIRLLGTNMHGSLVCNNTITTNGAGASVVGILIGPGITATNVDHNVLSYIGTTGATGWLLELSSATDSSVSYNTIDTCNGNYAIVWTGTFSTCKVDGNRMLSTTALAQIRCAAATNTSIDDNILSEFSAIGVQIIAGCTGSSISNNKMSVTAGTGRGLQGIYCNASVTFDTVNINNNIMKGLGLAFSGTGNFSPIDIQVTTVYTCSFSHNKIKSVVNPTGSASAIYVVGTGVFVGADASNNEIDTLSTKTGAAQNGGGIVLTSGIDINGITTIGNRIFRHAGASGRTHIAIIITAGGAAKTAYDINASNNVIATDGNYAGGIFITAGPSGQGIGNAIMSGNAVELVGGTGSIYPLAMLSNITGSGNGIYNTVVSNNSLYMVQGDIGMIVLATGGAVPDKVWATSIIGNSMRSGVRTAGAVIMNGAATSIVSGNTAPKIPGTGTYVSTYVVGNAIVGDDVTLTLNVAY
jgi:hypothetical protein